MGFPLRAFAVIAGLLDIDGAGGRDLGCQLGQGELQHAVVVLGLDGLGVNAGHDLDLENLAYFRRNVPYLNEVSIGHALICDALYLGLEETIKRYKLALR